MQGPRGRLISGGAYKGQFTVFRLARSFFFRIRSYLIIKMKLQYYVKMDVLTHTSKLKGVAEMTYTRRHLENKTKLKSKNNTHKLTR